MFAQGNPAYLADFRCERVQGETERYEEQGYRNGHKMQVDCKGKSAVNEYHVEEHPAMIFSQEQVTSLG